VCSSDLDTLEQLVLRPTVYPANIDFPTVNRPEASLNPAVSAQRQSQQQIQRFDIARFSEQEKRILTVFFQNKDMALSYADIAKYLGKSPNTIKNQMRQVSMKADLFNYTVGDESRKRFKLKDGLKIEKYLGISEDPTRWLARAIELDGMADRNRLDERPSRP
jgi:DNA-binding CsgD family transcriptional regulator